MRISCIIPIFNAENFLVESLESILSQQWPLYEVIAVNDGSTDRSAEMLKKYANVITIIEQRRHGIAAARNTGLRHASGDVIAFQDADDVWPQSRLKSLAQSLNVDPHVDCVAGLVQIRDERPVKPRFKEDLRTSHRLFLLGSLLIRRSVFDRVGPFNEKLKVVEDTEFIMRARQRGVLFRLIDIVSLIYRLHADNISKDVDMIQSNTLDALHVISLNRRRT
jgi:glycosyltransferase involved in cell wall biosynthesis